MPRTSGPVERSHRRDPRYWAVMVGTYGLLILLAVYFIFPFYTMLVASFMHKTALNSVDPNLWPDPFIVDNYEGLFSGHIGDNITLTTTFARALFNSLAVAIGQTIPALFFTSLVGFVFAKRRFPGREPLFIFVLITMMLPYQSTIVPFFLLMSNLGWINTFWPLWVPWWAPAFGVFLMRQIDRRHDPRRAAGRGRDRWCVALRDVLAGRAAP